MELPRISIDSGERPPVPHIAQASLSPQTTETRHSVDHHDRGIIQRDFGMSQINVIPSSEEVIHNGVHQHPEVHGHGQRAAIEHVLGTGDDFKGAFGTFNKFQEKLGMFIVKARPIGRSFALLTAARKLRDEVPTLEILFEENAAHLFETYRTFHYSLNDSNPPRRIWTKYARERNLHLGDFPKQMSEFAKALKEFRGRINEFSVWDDGSISLKTCLRVLEHDLKDWAQGLRDNSCGSVYSIPLQIYLYQRGIEISESLGQITTYLEEFINTGIPAIQDGQKRTDGTLGNISTGATFFSAVTATMLQISYSVEFVPIITVVNTLWYISLVLSIGATLNSILAMAWRQSVHGSRGRQLPMWVTVWIHGSSMICLVISILSFSIGLVLFTYSSHQHAVTSASTLALTLFTSFGIAFIGFWMLSEKLYALGMGKTKPSSGLLEQDLSLVQSPALGYFMTREEELPGTLKKAGGDDDTSIDVFAIGADSASEDSDDDYETIEAPNFQPLRDLLQQTRMKVNNLMTSREQLDMPPIEEEKADHIEENDSAARARWNWKRTLKTATQREPRLVFKRSPQTLLPIVNEKQQMPASPSDTRPTARESRVRRRSSAQRFSLQAGTGLPRCVAEEDVSEYGVIQHIRASPNGRFVAITCFREAIRRPYPRLSVSTTLIYQISKDNQLSNLKKYTHHSTTKTRQVIWSPDSSVVLVRQNLGILIWNLTTGVQKEVSSKSSVQSIIWYGKEKAFLCADRSRLVKRKAWVHLLPNLNIRDVTWVSPTQLAIIAHVVCTSEDHPSSRSRPTEKRILIYEIEPTSPNPAPWKPLSPVASVPASYIPTLENARHVTSSHTGHLIVSYRSRVPPQIFSPRDPSAGEEKHGLRLELTYEPMPAEFRGPSYATTDGSLILCSLKGSELHIWSPSSGKTILCFRPHEEEESWEAPLGAWGTVEDGCYTLVTGQGRKLKLWNLRVLPNT